MTRRHVAVVATLITLASGLTACSHSSNHASHSTPATAVASPIGATHLAGAELRFGQSASRIPGVTYQSSVVMIGGGASAVHSVSGDGLTWTIDANAPGASELAVGKVMMATSFGTGRVLALSRSGGDDEVTLGPVALTDVIRDGVIAAPAPIPIQDVTAYTTPDRAGAVVDDPQDPSGGLPPAGTRSAGQTRLSGGSDSGAAGIARPPLLGHVVAAPHLAPALAGGPLPAPSSTPSTGGAGDFDVTPFCCAGGAGVHIGYNHGDGRLSATLTLHMATPTATFRIAISGSKLTEASVALHGAGAVSIDITAATLSSSGNFRGKRVTVPETLAIPLGGALTLSLTQTFFITMQMAGKASLKTHGDYNVAGDLGFGWRNGGPFLNAASVATSNPMTANTKSYGVASNAISLGWGLKASVGVGLIGFSAGAWFQLGVAMAMVADTTLDVLSSACVRDSLVVSGRYGVGYTIPELVADAINAVLGLVGAKPIAASGGPSWGPFDIWRPPPGNWCPH